jgi:hypothetical protein
MKAVMPKHKHKAPPLLNTTLVESHFEYCLCLNKKDFKAALKNLGVPKREWPNFEQEDIGAITYEFDTRKSGLCAIILMNVRPGATVEHVMSVLVHEAVHVWQFHRDWIGERRPSAEFEAYSIQAISRNLFYAYSEHLAKNK